MTTIAPARILRAHAEDRDTRLKDLNQHERRQLERILDHAPSMFRRFGRPLITMANFACALKMSPATVKKHFCDLDSLLYELLRTHLMDLAKAIGEIPADTPDRAQASRAAYLAATRKPFCGLAEMHYLLIHERQNLPPDLRNEIDEIHHQLGIICAGGADLLAPKLLAMLDSPFFDLAEIETTIAALAAPAAAAPQAVAPQASSPQAGTPQAGKPGRSIVLRKNPAPPPDDDIDDLTRISGVTHPGGLLINHHYG